MIAIRSDRHDKCKNQNNVLYLAFTVKSVSFKSFDLQTPQGMRNCSTSVTAAIVSMCIELYHETHTIRPAYSCGQAYNGGVQGGYWITNHEERKFPFTVSR